MKSFNSLPLSSSLQKVIQEFGYQTMTPVQNESIATLLEGHDFIGQAQTGSGKTAAFVIPIVEKLEVSQLAPQVLILCPTRELGDQVLQECKKFSKAKPGTICLGLFGGQPLKQQAKTLEQGAHILVGTPGRTLDLLNSGHLYTEAIKTFVLDEADRLLEEGFSEEIDGIVSYLPVAKQTVFFSATFSADILQLSQKYQVNARQAIIEEKGKDQLNIDQILYSAENSEKYDTLFEILKKHVSGCTLIFCRTKQTVKDLGEILKGKGLSCGVLHGDLEQSERDQATMLFRNGSFRILVATDVAARGLDIDSLELVINLDLPPSADVYIHRIGRTGRAGRSGTAVSIATSFEAPFIAEIENQTKVKFNRPTLTKGDEFPSLLREPVTKTIMIAGGKKDKLRAGDILGALTSMPDAIHNEHVGKILTQDRASLVAIKFSSAAAAMKKLTQSKIKGKKFKIYFVS